MKIEELECVVDKCVITVENEKETISGLVWIAVSKSELENCNSISFLLKDCFIPEENQ